MKQQLLTKEETYNKMLADVCQRWERTAQTWVQMREELEQKIQEGKWLRQEDEQKTKEELQRLSEAIIQLEYNKPSLGCHLIVVEGFACPNDPRSSVVWGYMPLVGPPMANRS
ncbi:hypothetical protein D4764_15G0009840 [Takifugu flavidus]|uniref:Uncharacterized protein n=1 Tax=Takifugu flavidus TaxID=433684 RepID=A0A5C6P5X4_9TELE|nr:hypothetical protein D4764_15G0009840 [Takifugu flavidus]